MKNILYITSTFLIMSLGIFNINMAMNEPEAFETGTKSLIIESVCASGSCRGEADNICDYYSEWIIGECNDNGVLPCKKPIEKE